MFFRSLGCISLIIAAGTEASPLEPRGDNYVKLQVVHSTNKQVFSDFYRQKRAVAEVPLANRTDVAYYAKLDFGTPAQPIYVQIDTGSFELWVNPDCAALSDTTDESFCNNTGHYESSQSTTFATLSSDNVLQYGIGNASIDYVTDTIAIAGTSVSLKNVQFGVAQQSTEEFAGILGIGFGQNITIPYKNLIDQLAAQGATNTKAFSIALGSKDEKEGVAIFGGLDTSKFTGALATQPIIAADKSPDGVPRYWIQMESVGLTASGQSKKYADTSIPVFLDSGSTLSLLPTNLTEEIAADFGAQEASGGVFLVNCSIANQNGSLNFAFNGVTVEVPFNEVIREVETNFGTECELGIEASDEFTLLGDTFLRSAYAVFDQTNNEVHLAQYANCGESPMEITADMSFSSITGNCTASGSTSATTSTSGSNLTSTTDTGSGDNSTVTGGTSDSESGAVRNCFTWLAFCAAFCIMLL
ncbi:aspartic peptidase domain-containing protein [Xylariaceae sp. FL0255]|nr:aspartic peptidase domain-containing protein [Xylariaceae sp. FL0255]